MKTIIKTQLFVLVLGASLLKANVEKSPDQGLADIQQAVQLLQQARESQQQSRQQFVDANKIRKQLKTLRAKARQQQQTKSDSSEAEISKLVLQLEKAQQQGAELRVQSESLKSDATSNFTKGFIDLWGDWVTNTRPLTMDETVEDFFAHNTRIRSVHKNMPKRTLSDEVTSGERPDMSLLVPSLVGQNAPPNLDIGAFKFSRKEIYFAHIEVHQDSKAENAATEKTSANVAAVPLNQIHQWRLLVTDLNGKPVENIKFKVEGHMPGHVHGLPTAPRVMGEIQPGVYLVDGLKFQMKGWWVMKFVLMDEKFEKNPTQADFFTFNLVL